MEISIGGWIVPTIAWPIILTVIFFIIALISGRNASHSVQQFFALLIAFFASAFVWAIWI